MTTTDSTPRRASHRLRSALLASLWTGLALWGSLSSASAQVLIDDFSTAQAQITDPSGGSSTAVTGGTDIIGQSRSLTVLRVAGTGTVAAEVTGGALDFTIDDTTPDTRGDLLVVWDGDDHTSFDPTGLLGQDLTDGGTTGGLRFDVAEAPAGVSLLVTIYEDAANVSRAGRVLPAIASPTSLYVDWSELVAAPGAVGPADLTNVGAITLLLSGTEVPLLSITHVEAVGPQVAASKVDREPAGGDIPPGVINPGEQIRYRVTITNPGAGAEGVDFDDTLDTNTALVGGSVRTTPLARRDQYATITDTALDSDAEMLDTLLANDVDLDGNALAAVAVTGQATAQGGTVDVDAAGDFVYTPLNGFNGVDSFTYTIQATAGDPTVDAAGNAIGAITGRAYVVIDRVPPTLAGAGTVSYTEDDPPVAIAPSLTVTDPDSPNLASATVEITNVLDGADEKLGTGPACSGLTVGGAGTSMLTISGSATLLTYRNCLRSVTYDNDDQDPNGSDRSVDFQVSDGLLLSNVETATVQVVPVNDKPVVTTSMGSSSFTEDQPPVVVDGALTVTDVDDANIESAMVVITNVLDPTFESLAVTSPGTNCTGLTVTPGTTLTVTGSATKATYQTCLRNVTYNNLDQDPNATDRSISFKVNDGDLDSDLAFKTVTVTPVNDPPVADDDAWDFIGNTELAIDQAAPATPTVSATTTSTFGVLDGDADPAEGDALTVTSITVGGCTDSTPPLDCSDAAVGRVQMGANGRFLFTPIAGDTDASETFTYVVTDDGTPMPASDTGMVTLTRMQRVWYVNNTFAGTPTGVSSAPFNTLVAAETPSVAGDTIYVHTGVGTTGQNAGISLKANQRFLGEGVALDVPVSVNGGPNPTVLRAAGTRPHITKTTNNQGTVRLMNVAGVLVRGFQISSSTGSNVHGVLVSTTGANAGGATIRDNVFSGTGTATSHAIAVTAAGTGAMALTIRDNMINAATNNGVDIVFGSTGTQSLALHDNSFTVSGTAVNVNRTSATGTTTITAFDDNVVSGNTGGSGIVVAGAGAAITLDSDTGTAGLQSVPGGTTVIGALGNPVTSAGLTLANVTGALDFTDLDVFAGTSGVTITGTGAFTGAAGTRVTVPNNVTMIEAGNGPGVSANNLTLDFRLNALTVTASPTTGVNLVSISDATVAPTAAQFSAPSTATIAATTGTAFNVDGGNATISYAGTINNSSGRSVIVQNRTADTATFTGGITDTGQGILVNSNNVASTTSFQGGLSLTTGTNAAFTATSGGTLSVCDENPCNPGATGLLVNTLTTTTGTALNVSSTTISANNLEFRSISAGTGASGPTNGVLLSATGSSGGLKVKGTGSAGTGGTIQNCTGDGVSLTDTRNAELAWMNLTSNDDAGLYGSLVTNLTLTRLSIQNNTNGLVEAGLELDNLFGINTFTGLEVSGSTEDNIRVRNSVAPGTGTLTSLEVLGTGGTGSTCRILNNSTGSGNVGINIQAAGTADMNGVDVHDCFLQGNRTVAIRGDAADSSQLEMEARNNVIIAGSPNQGNQGIEFGAATSAQMTFFDIDNNKVGTDGVTNSPLINTGINVSAGGTSSCAMSGHVRNNTVVNAGAGQSGFGIRVFQSSACEIEANVAGNTVSNVGLDYGLLVESGGSAGATGRVDAAVTGNNVSVLAGALDAIRAQARNGSVMCARITGNTTTHPNDAGCGGANPSTFCGLVVRQANTAVFNLEGSGGSCPAGAQTAAQAAACVASQNSEDSVGSFAATGFNGVATNFCTNIPN